MPRKPKPPPPPSVRQGYVEEGVAGYYRRHAADYRNPHEAIIAASLAELVARQGVLPSPILDLACGSGEVTLALEALGARDVTGVDPYTGPAYHARTGRHALPISFEAIADGALADRQFALVVCSFALHLLPASRLPGTLTALSLIAPCLWTLSPHKRPVIRPGWGWTRSDAFTLSRVHAVAYRAGTL
ncbi:MAG: class I SAM-dependent methyltransferase [Thermoflexales bacterium]|nr:class I SAM-dependent methyltransferase [Thermoflexales bacterium]